MEKENKFLLFFGDTREEKDLNLIKTKRKFDNEAVPFDLLKRFEEISRLTELEDKSKEFYAEIKNRPEGYLGKSHKILKLEILLYALAGAKELLIDIPKNRRESYIDFINLVRPIGQTVLKAAQNKKRVGVSVKDNEDLKLETILMRLGFPIALGDWGGQGLKLEKEDVDILFGKEFLEVTLDTSSREKIYSFFTQKEKGSLPARVKQAANIYPIIHADENLKEVLFSIVNCSFDDREFLPLECAILKEGKWKIERLFEQGDWKSSPRLLTYEDGMPILKIYVKSWSAEFVKATKIQ
jgi:hypothetical protein